MKHEKKILRKRIGNWTLEGPIDEALKSLINAKAQWEQLGYTDIVIETESDYDYGSSGCGDYYETVVYGKLLETDKEFEKRCKLEDKAEEAKKYLKKVSQSEERLLYERLKKKYGKSLASNVKMRTIDTPWGDPTGS